MAGIKVFISSTIEDLGDARAGIAATLAEVEVFEPITVESLPATDESSRAVCLDQVRASQVFVLLLSRRYGFVPTVDNPEHLSVTHLEYREARRLGIPIFAFFRDADDREPRLEEFIQEASDFDSGLFRKSWSAPAILAVEVRRSLLFWLARQSRARLTSGLSQDQTKSLIRCPELSEFPLDVIAEDSPSVRDWVGEFSGALEALCRERGLPIPKPLSTVDQGRHPFTLVLRLNSGSELGVLRASLSLVPTSVGDGSQSPLGGRTILAVFGPNGAYAVARIGVAMVFLTVEDAFHAFDELVSVGRDSSADDQVRASALAIAAEVSIGHQIERVHDLVSSICRLTRIDDSLIGIAQIAIMAAQQRLEGRGAARAIAAIDLLALELLEKAVASGSSSTSTFYNLARQTMRHSHSAALVLFDRLVELDPSYDGRWYFHRDIGQVLYGAERYRDAALHYDLACRQKPDDSELWRFAGDAYYYSGQWKEALLRYDRALEIEPIERYFLGPKVDYAKSRLGRFIESDRHLPQRRAVARRLSAIGIRLAHAGYLRLAAPWLKVARWLCELDFYAFNGLALIANRQGRPSVAANLLRKAAHVIPEDPGTHLNLAVNLLAASKKPLEGEAREQLRLAIFHGGSETRNQLKLRLFRSPDREAILADYDVLSEEVMQLRAEWIGRRLLVNAPQLVDGTQHIEIRA